MTTSPQRPPTRRLGLDTPELRNAFAGRSCLLPDGTSDEVQPAA